MHHTSFKHKFIGLLLLSTFLFGNLSAFAQTGRAASGAKTQTANNQTKTEKKDCNSGYTGSVNYTKIVSTTSSGKFGSYTNMKRAYQANIIVRDDGRQQGSTTMSETGLTGSFNLYGQATASVSETDSRLDVSEKDEYCKMSLKGAGAAQRVHCESKYTRKTEASGTSGDANVFIGLKGRTLALSLGNLPKLAGTSSVESASVCTGTCSPQKPIGSSSTIEVHNAGERTARAEEDKITFNPQSFNRLSGTWTRTEPTPGGTVSETFQWNLSRCAPPLEIADLTFEHKRVPNPDQWTGVDPLAGTVDGNIVKIKAKVFNNGGDTAYANVKFSEIKSGEDLPDGKTSIAVKPGEFRDVEYEWDTSGYAWNESRKNESNREIRATLEGGNTETAKIKIVPKPVIMVHGLWSNAAAWAEYANYLREAHSFAWQGYAVGSDPANGKMSTGDHPGNYKPTNTIYQNAQELAKQIKFARETNNAWHVDIVAHSMGGLISRQYINTFMQPIFDGKPEVTHLVMLGTPNMGSPCADTVNEAFENTDNNEMHAMRELKPIIVRAFNTRVADRKGVKFSVLIGVIPIPRTCLAAGVFGDGVVPIESAKYNLTDYAYAPRDHISLTGIEDFKAFVMPRLAIGPKKARAERSVAWLENQLNENYALANENSFERGGFNDYFRKISFIRENAPQTDEKSAADNVTVKQKIVLAPKQTREIEIPAEAGKEAGVLLVASTAVVATLTDASGAVLGKSEGGLEAMKNLFRMIVAGKNPSGGAMKLKLENFDTKETVVFVAGFADSGANQSFTVEAGKPGAAGTVPLTAKLIADNSPVLNAKITAGIVGGDAEIEFFDDGRHGDGAAGDGVYGAVTEKLAKGEYFVEAKAEVNNSTKLAIAQIKVGGAPSSPKTATRKGK
jgi:pimeloyl-ACP methyl ester carboxylesterase